MWVGVIGDTSDVTTAWAMDGRDDDVNDDVGIPSSIRADAEARESGGCLLTGVGVIEGEEVDGVY